ncbi:hypothetical protein [Paenibacillus sp. V4I5]|uniref:hypothetical protein n=1 Tax=Paenibacillus sp. V4I5 TaxID=3042306 RepID=UPI00278EC57B|nr:hypothetical protein [Paenibacillus sp. V4I5]MDQ0917038.1 hypothetical protein [Paenibacillus sp. V4I5]
MTFYSFSSDEGKKKKFATGVKVVLRPPSFEDIHCSDCGIHWRKTVNSEEGKAQFVLTNNHYADFLYSSDGLLISERAIEVFDLEGISGYSKTEIIVSSPKETPAEFQRLLRLAGENVKKMPENPPQYYMVMINGLISLHQEQNLKFIHCNKCGLVRAVSPGSSFINTDHNLIIDASSWRCEDIMNTNYPARNVCTERFIEIYHKHELTGLIFSDLTSR